MLYLFWRGHFHFRSCASARWSQACRRYTTSNVQGRDGGESIRFSIGAFGPLAEGSVTCSKQNTMVHAVVTSSYNADAKDDFLPLTVDYRDRLYAHGQIPQTNNQRERHNSDEEILASRVIDRAIRPLFPSLYLNEVQIIVTAHSVDGVEDPVALAVNAVSCALMQSRQPWDGPVGCVRVGIVDGIIKVNPTVHELESSPLNLLYAGTRERPLMQV